MLPARYILGRWLFASATAVLAQAPSPSAQNLDVAALCQFVAENIHEDDPAPGTDKVYKTRLFTAAGVDPRADTKEVIAKKMQVWWNQNQHQLICNVANSIVRNGSILKLAADRSSYDFIIDVARRWKVDLNRIDADGTTVLDFIDAEQEKVRDTPRFATLNRYYNIFAGSGAKHERDLR